MIGRELLDVQDVAAMTRLAVSTLYSRRTRKEGPPSFKLGGRVVYDRAAVEQWIREQEAESTIGSPP